MQLAEKHPAAALEKAAKAATHHGACSLRDLKRLLFLPGNAANGLSGKPSADPSLVFTVSNLTQTQLQTHDSTPNHLRQLRLSGLMQTPDVRLQEVAAARLGHGEFLELIFQDELNVWHQSGCWPAAPRPPSSTHSKRSKTSTGSSTRPDNRVNKSSNWPLETIYAKARTSSFLARPASEKPTLAQALGYEAISRARKSSTAPSSIWCGTSSKTKLSKQQDKTLRSIISPRLTPIIDDMGLKALPKQSGEYLLEVIMRRYENRSTIMTSNRPLEDWGKLLSDVPTAGAILDRFLHHAIAIAITGRSYRVKDSLPATENKKPRKPNEPSPQPAEPRQNNNQMQPRAGGVEKEFNWLAPLAVSLAAQRKHLIAKPKLI